MRTAGATKVWVALRGEVGMSFTKWLQCCVVGHQPLKDRAQKHKDSFRAPCGRCGGTVQRVRSGVWRGL